VARKLISKDAMKMRKNMCAFNVISKPLKANWGWRRGGGGGLAANPQSLVIFFFEEWFHAIVLDFQVELSCRKFGILFS
jgi:hypothetical protein